MSGFEEVSVSFLHPERYKEAFKVPPGDDIHVMSHQHILTIILNPSTATG